MKGEEVKNILANYNYSQSEIARRMNVSGQCLFKALQSNDIKSGTLEQIAKALGKDMGMFYEIHAQNVNQGNVAGNFSQGADMSKALELMQAQLEAKDQLINKLIDIINAR